MSDTIKIRNKATSEMVTLRRKQDYGEIGVAPSRMENIIAQTQRKVALPWKAALGDVPFVRNILPEEIRNIQPESGIEKTIYGGTKLARDIGLYTAAPEAGIGRQALAGAGMGIATAGTEDPKEILKSGIKTSFLLPILKRTDKLLTPLISRTVRKGLKTTRQAWQDLIRAGFMVEKSTVQKAQQKGVESLLSKKVDNRIGVSLRDDEAFLRLANKIHDGAIKLRRKAGNTVGRWRNMLFKNKRIRVSTKSARDSFQKELQSPQINLLDEFGNSRIPVEIGSDTTANRLLEVNEFLKTSNEYTPEVVYKVIDKLDDLYRKTRGTNEGRIVDKLRRSLKRQIYKSAPRNIRTGLETSDAKFSEIANATDDVFDKLKLQVEGVAKKERIGAAEQALNKGLRKGTPVQERNIWKTIDTLLPQEDKFMNLYEDIFASQDIQREGIGWLMRRLFLAPRMAGAGLQAIQPIMRGLGKLGAAAGQTTRKVVPPVVLRKAIEQ